MRLQHSHSRATCAGCIAVTGINLTAAGSEQCLQLQCLQQQCQQQSHACCSHEALGGQAAGCILCLHTTSGDRLASRHRDEVNLGLWGHTLQCYIHDITWHVTTEVSICQQWLTAKDKEEKAALQAYADHGTWQWTRGTPAIQYCTPCDTLGCLLVSTIGATSDLHVIGDYNVYTHIQVSVCSAHHQLSHVNALFDVTGLCPQTTHVHAEATHLCSVGVVSLLLAAAHISEGDLEGVLLLLAAHITGNNLAGTREDVGYLSDTGCLVRGC